jgi:uncharacterized protein (DUF169 family)
MKYNSNAAQMTNRLQLSSPPVALSFVKEPPAGVPAFEGQVPSACTFWREAEARLFYAPAEKHFNCPIGVMTMGLEMTSDVQQNLMTIVEMMCGAKYIGSGEPANIPSVKGEKAGIVYGPLADFPIEPELVLMWLNNRQAMLYNEAAGTCHWTGQGPAHIFGRPACAALPMALDASEATLSLGCLGMRTFTDVADDRLLAVLPGGKIAAFCDALESAVSANEQMGSFYREHKAKFQLAATS